MGWPAASKGCHWCRSPGKQAEREPAGSSAGISEDFFRQMSWVLRREEGPSGLVENVSQDRMTGRGGAAQALVGSPRGWQPPGHSERRLHK